MRFTKKQMIEQFPKYFNHVLETDDPGVCKALDSYVIKRIKAAYDSKTGLVYDHLKATSWNGMGLFLLLLLCFTGGLTIGLCISSVAAQVPLNFFHNLMAYGGKWGN